MIVLHAGFLDERLLLWGETPHGEDAPQPQRARRRSKALGRQPSPYDAKAHLLSAALQGAGLPLLERCVRARKAVAWLPTAPDAFWGKGGPGADRLGEVRIPPAPGLLPKRLGNFPFWRGEGRLLDVMERFYREASVAGLDMFLGEEHVGKGG